MGEIPHRDGRLTDKRFHSICCYLSYLAQSDPDLRDDAVDRFCEAYGLRRRSCFGFVKNLCASIIAMRLNYQGHRFGRTKAKAQPQSEAPPSRPIYPPTVPPSERQRAVWDGLNVWVGDRGGQITSQPYAQPIVLEVPLDSPLPEKLRSLGWDPIYRGRETRIGTAPAEYDRAGPQRPVTGYAFNQRDVYHLVAPRR